MNEKYRIEIKRSAQKEIKNLPKKDVQRIVEMIQKLASNPRGDHSVKLSSQERYRIRVGHYRILYEIHDLVLIIMIVRGAHRKEVYR